RRDRGVVRGGALEHRREGSVPEQRWDHRLEGAVMRSGAMVDVRQDDGGSDMRKIAAMLGLVSFVVFHGWAPAHAQPVVNVTQVADQPAATLLLPYFEVSLPTVQGGKPKGLTTLFSINNASATAVLAHTTIWSELAVPVF